MLEALHKENQSVSEVRLALGDVLIALNRLDEAEPHLAGAEKSDSDRCFRHEKTAAEGNAILCPKLRGHARPASSPFFPQLPSLCSAGF